MPFETFHPTRDNALPPVATLDPNGSLRLSAAAHDLIGRAETVQLAYAPDDNVLSITPAIASETTYHSTTGIISLRALLTHYGIARPDEPIRYDAVLQDGALLVQLAVEAIR